MPWPFNARRALYETIEPIIAHEGPLKVSGEECRSFREYFQQDMTVNAVMQETLYRQGYLDCVRLLTLSGIL